ncbi:ER to golgi family transport-related protein [Trichosporon asahii var. asahii CBS 2479]|uniref:ER to golgi family transport-related protein n=1 Tax=Trichosporon asahii var. asahii (strain ATCC 90039 / CBS 2479 / JCM 2466 / KCTC 7840 / NBRC 103889/ NCYC 2677 / UAMH 7654) TaxID=1186058 RepID=J5TA59_TRIAS|nr:ER to golgi family transport-related protein [Trichosporon asahii var. asahii CBS 2479]EJT49946.1 ER to golgi family transport-related protein [Trichosporon asahii var. asahii CBS 2479]
MSASAALATPTSSTFPTDDKLASPAMFGDNDEEDLTFENAEEEASYYRDKYRVATSSRELEQELEKELEATEAKQQELKDRIHRLEKEKDEWRTKSVQQQKQHSSTVSAMQREMDNLRTERDKTLVALRDLEMGNDELERNERVAVSSLLDMEIKYNRAIEEKTLLEQEIIVKQDVEEENQRLKDECRDANNEISILRDQLARATVPTPPASNSPMSPMPENAEASQSRAPSAASRSETDSPAPSDKSTATQRSEKSLAAGPRRSLQSPSVTPRARTTASPRVARTAIPALSPATKRSTSSPANSAIPALSRSTATRNLAGSTTTSATAKRLGYQPSPGTARAVSNVNNGTNQPKTKGFQLLHNLQARMRATDDRLNTRVSKRNVSTPGSTIGGTRRFPSSATSANLKSSTAAHNRVSQLSKSTTVTTLAGDKGPDGLFSPTNWVLVSDGEDTPTANGHGAPRRSEPASPLERSTFGPDRKSARSLPQRPGIPSPLAPALSRSVRAPPQASSQASRFTSSTASRAGLGVSTSRPPSRSHQRSESVSMRPPSRTHRRTESSSTRPPSRSHTRSHSRADSRSGSRTGASSPAFGERMSPESVFLAAAQSSRPGSRAGSRSVSRASYEDDGELIDEEALERELARRNTLSSSTLGKSRLSASATGTYRRVPRRSSLGPAEASLPPSAIPAPKTTPSRPTSYPVFQNTPPPPVPRIPSMHARARQGQ